MKRLLLAFIVCVLMGVSAFAQTTVNLTVTDTPDKQLWANGTWSVKLQQAAGNLSQTNSFTLLTGGGSLAAQSGALSGTATAAISLPANANIGPGGTVWQFTVCPQATASCFQQSVTVSVSSPQTLSITPPSIRINLSGATPPITAYATGEITGATLGSQFYLIGSGQQFCTVVVGGVCTTWAGSSGSTPSSPGFAPGILASNYSSWSAKTVYGCAWTNGQATITGCPSGTFAASDVGKKAWATNANSNVPDEINPATIVVCPETTIL